MGELLDRLGGGLEPVGERGAEDHGAHREVARRQGLGRDDRLRLEAERLAAPGGAGAAEAGDDLVRDERDAVPCEDRGDRLEVALGRGDHAAGAHDGLRDEDGDGASALAGDDVLELGGQAGGEGGLVLALPALAPEMGAGQVHEARQRQAEERVVGLARHRGADRGDAMIAVRAREDRAPLGRALGPGEEPQHLDQRVVRLGSGVGVEDAAPLERADLDQLLRQLHRAVGHAAEEGVVPGKARVLLLRRADQAGMVPAGDHVPEAGIGVEVAAAARVDDVGPLAMGQDDGAAFADRRQVGEAVERGGVRAGFPALGGMLVHGARLRPPPGGVHRARAQRPMRSRRAKAPIASGSSAARPRRPPGKARAGSAAIASQSGQGPAARRAARVPAWEASATPWPE